MSSEVSIKSTAPRESKAILAQVSTQGAQRTLKADGEQQVVERDELEGGFEDELDELFGLDDESKLGAELDRLISAARSGVDENPLPAQLPDPLNGQRRRLAKRKETRALAPRATSAELLVADELSRYLHEVRRYPLLEREEERALAESYYEDGDHEAAKRLVTGNLRLVVKIAQQYRRAWVNVMDLIQEGNIGLGEAVKRFDPYRGVRFSSFARYWIRALILQFILKNFRLISFANTRAGRKLFFRLEKERTRLMQLYGEATTQQLALALEVSEEDVEAATLLNQPMLSLDAPRYQGEEGGETWEGSIQDEGQEVAESYADDDYRQIINQHIQSFGAQISNERELIIWRERMLSDDPTSLSALGERFAVSRERVRQLEQRLKDRLRDHLKQEMGAEISVDVSTD